MSENEVIPPDVLVMSLGMFSWVTCKCVCVCAPAYAECEQVLYEYLALPIVLDTGQTTRPKRAHE